ncbi:DoxX family protein [Achromobacter sp. GG226]|uniref:DoxX family protein n=1 Tax=Verticiella alkaliphila TaxID=2779529 RepID=UPI001C0C722E|nr:DoxX family protein [Verticiella sp. GG226]MBU4612127.1 DoxX family protein [Verticiella sp. GG226]
MSTYFSAPQRQLPATLLRILIGAWYLPHVYGKIVGFDNAAGFFAKAGLQPGNAFVVLAGVAELAVALALIFGVFTRYAALGSALIMAVAAYAIVAVGGWGWAWSGGGIEYLVFWGIVSLIVFAQARGK